MNQPEEKSKIAVIKLDQTVYIYVWRWDWKGNSIA